ncbi:hypothetical protein ACQE32_14880 [Pantoea sp. FN0302]|uniref:hypothetical protein n=1 Tax=unclassified Pantoea TaxID=2630326 RepID=UPI003CF82187
MKKFTLLLFLLFSPIIQAQELSSEGILQAYWKAEWNGEGTVNEPELALRFFPAETSSSWGKVFDIRLKNQRKAIEFVIRNFKVIPDNFLLHKEWFVNQKGTVFLKNPEHYIECSTENYMAILLDFIPDFSAKASDTTAYEEMGRCGYNGARPFLTSYYLNPEYKKGYFLLEPNDNADYVKTFTIRDRLVKIKTINEKWIYATIYDDQKENKLGDTKGYINIKYLLPFN